MAQEINAKLVNAILTIDLKLKDEFMEHLQSDQEANGHNELLHSDWDHAEQYKDFIYEFLKEHAYTFDKGTWRLMTIEEHNKVINTSLLGNIMKGLK